MASNTTLCHLLLWQLSFAIHKFQLIFDNFVSLHRKLHLSGMVWEKVVNESYDKQANVIDDLKEDVEKFKCEAQYWENAYLNLVKKVGV